MPPPIVNKEDNTNPKSTIEKGDIPVLGEKREKPQEIKTPNMIFAGIIGVFILVVVVVALNFSKISAVFKHDKKANDKKLDEIKTDKDGKPITSTK